LTGSGSIVEMGFPPEGGVASRLTYQGEEFTRTSPWATARERTGP